MLNDSIVSYIGRSSSKPFFYVVGNEKYVSACDDLKTYGFKHKSVCDFCDGDDKFPNIDTLVDEFQTADVNYASSKFYITGLGEYLVLCNEKKANSVLRKLWDTLLGSARVVIVLRFVNRQVIELLDSDIRFKSQNRFFLDGNDFNVPLPTNVNEKISNVFVKTPGVKFLIQQIESLKAEASKRDRIFFTSELDFSDASIYIDDIRDSFSAVQLLTNCSNLQKSNGDDSQWAMLLDDIAKQDFSINKVFQSNKISNESTELESNILNYVFKGNKLYQSWLYFLCLKINVDKIKNDYLKRVVLNSSELSSFKDKIISEIISIPYNNPEFKSFYDARKKLIRGVKDVDMDKFVNQKCVSDPGAGLYCLTDNTLLERESIVRWISDYADNKVVSENYFQIIREIYPDLAAYMENYEFDCGNLSQEFTSYFNKYRRQKLINKIDDDFLQGLPENSKKYARLDSRASKFLTIDEHDTTYLYWIDALGVEYLSFIQYLASEAGLSMHVDIVRADLPTITEFNNSFYNDWSGPGKYKEGRLDRYKHKDDKRYNYEKCKAPIHLASELDIIREAVKHAEDELDNGYKKFIIASDHGASRLAVICEKEIPYDTETGGVHSGRCCKSFDYSESNFNSFIEENGYMVLTDYGRFRGSRKANVEVHGGACLEETVIPIITLSRRESNYEIMLVSKEIKIDKNTGISFDIYASGVGHGKGIQVRVHKGSEYFECYTEQNSLTSYRVRCEKIKRWGEYTADVYAGDEKISSLVIKVKGAAGSANDAFDNLF